MKRSLVFVLDSLESGGAERVVSLLASSFILLGYNVTIISKKNSKPFYELNPEVVVWSPAVQINYNNRFVRIYTSVLMYFEILRYIYGKSPSLILPISTSTSGILVLIGKILKISTIVCEHNNYKAGLNFFYNWFIKRYLYKLAYAIVVLTYRDKFEFYDKIHKRVHVIPNSLSLQPISSERYSKRQPVVLAIGNLDSWHRKGLDTLVKVFHKVFLNFPSWKLLIVGGGEGILLKEMVKERGIEDNVIWGGLKKNIEEVMRECSVFVLTSRWEGLPMVLIESMSQGLPCIAFDCYSGPADIITHGFNGYLVEDQNSEAFEMALEHLMSNEAERERLAKNALSSSKDYLPHQVIPLWLSLFNSIK